MAEFKKTLKGRSRVGPPPPLATYTVSEPRCKVCTFAQRREVDMQLALGWGPAAVRRFWNQIIEAEGGEADYFKKSSVESHANKHLSVKDGAVRRILERRAELEGMDITAVEGFLTTKSGVAEALVHLGLESLHKGDTMVEPKDILAAVQTLMQLEEKRSVVAEEVMLREIRAFMAAVKRNVDEKVWEAIYRDYKLELGEPLPAAIHVAPDDVKGED